MVFLVDLEVLSEVSDPVGEQRCLDLRRARILLVKSVALNRVRLLLFALYQSTLLISFHSFSYDVRF